MNGFSLERRSLAIAALVLVALATASFGAVSYAGAKADERRGLSERFVQDMRAAATRAAADERLAVLAQRRRDAKLLVASTVAGLSAGMVRIIDYTPLEPAMFGGSFQSRRDVAQPALGSATEFIFQGGTLPECQSSRCIDFIINDGQSGAGFGVLAGGPDFALAQRVARTAMESLAPRRS